MESGERQSADAEQLLLAFVRERDVECPQCGYNLRNLTRAVCPECHLPLALGVGTKQYRLGPLLAFLAPGYFSGITTGIVFFVAMTFGDVDVFTHEPLACFTLLFGIASGAVALFFSLQSRRFVRMHPEKQAGLAFISWLLHFVAFLIVISGG